MPMVWLAASYRRTCPVDMTHLHIADVYAASRAIEAMLENRETGLLRHPLRQLRTALRIARG